MATMSTVGSTTTRLLVGFAVLYRLFLITLSLLANGLVTDYDTSTRVMLHHASPSPSTPSHILTNDTSEGSLLGTWSRWDAVYFLRIAQVGGYEYEHFHAFFPLYPFICRWTAMTIQWSMSGLLSFEWLRDDLSVLQVAALLVTNACFLLSILVLKKLSFALFYTQSRTRDEADRISFYCCVLYIINPASVFMTAIYTESIFSLFSMLGMYFYVSQLKIRAVDCKDSRKITVDHNGRYALGSAVMFALASGVRSNGILLSGFFLYDFLRLGLANCMQQSWWRRVKFAMWTTLQVALTFAPYMCLQAYGYYLYCTPHGNPNLEILSESAGSDLQESYLAETHPWCLHRVPHLYNFVQGRYWNVGFLKYYQVAQIPNFLLAAPIIIISIAGVLSYAKSNAYTFFTLGLLSTVVKRPQASTGLILQQISRTHSRTRRFSSVGSDVSSTFYTNNAHLLVFVYYWFFVTLYCLCLINVQVMTRFIASSCPIVYWFGASLLVTKGGHKGATRSSRENTEERSKRTHRKRRRFLLTSSSTVSLSWRAWLLLFYFVAYGIVGCVLFCNFYPWT